MGIPTAPIEINAAEQDLTVITPLAWRALQHGNKPPSLFRFGGHICRIETDEQGRPVTSVLTPDRMRHALAKVAEWVIPQKDGDPLPAKPPGDIVRDVLATPDPPLPVLEAIVEVPVFGPDGSLQTTPGYHSGSRTLYMPPPSFQLPQVSENPTSQELEKAKEWILAELLVDFPFVAASDRAHATALFLLPFARNLIAGPTPLHLVEKPKAGTGATLLVEMLMSVATGRTVPTMTEGRDEEEWRRRLTSKFRSCDAVLFLDNVRHRLDSAQLASAITSTLWEDRLIGDSEMLRLPVRCVWVATGNNPSISDEIARRSIRIRMDAVLEQPWLGREFRHPDLRGWVQENRTELIWAALTLIRAGIAADSPPSQKSLGMFEDWSRLMGKILNNAGIPGFRENLDEFYQSADTEEKAWKAFLGLWWDRHRDGRVGVSDLHSLAGEGDSALDLGDGTDKSQKISLGKKLSSMRDRQFVLEIGGKSANVRLVDGGRQNHSQMWRLAEGGRK